MHVCKGCHTYGQKATRRFRKCFPFLVFIHTNEHELNLKYLSNSFYFSLQIMPPKKNNGRKNENQPAPLPIQEDSLDEHVSHTEFRVSCTTLAHSVVSQNNQ